MEYHRIKALSVVEKKNGEQISLISHCLMPDNPNIQGLEFSYTFSINVNQKSGTDNNMDPTMHAPWLMYNQVKPLGFSL